jgi:hypothetical protein
MIETTLDDFASVLVHSITKEEIDKPNWASLELDENRFASFLFEPR